MKFVLVLLVIFCTAQAENEKICLVPCTRFVAYPVPVPVPVVPSNFGYWPHPMVRRKRELPENGHLCKVAASVCFNQQTNEQSDFDVLNKVEVPSVITEAMSSIGPVVVPMVSAFAPVIQQVPFHEPLEEARKDKVEKVPERATETPEESKFVYSKPFNIRGDVKKDSLDLNSSDSDKLKVEITTVKPTTEVVEQLQGLSYCLIKGTSNKNEMVSCNVIDYFPMKDCTSDASHVAVCTADGTEKSSKQRLECNVIENEQFMCKEVSD